MVEWIKLCPLSGILSVPLDVFRTIDKDSKSLPFISWTKRVKWQTEHLGGGDLLTAHVLPLQNVKKFIGRLCTCDQSKICYSHRQISPVAFFIIWTKSYQLAPLEFCCAEVTPSLVVMDEWLSEWASASKISISCLFYHLNQNRQSSLSWTSGWRWPHHRWPCRTALRRWTPSPEHKY